MAERIEAKVKSKIKTRTVIAFGGHEYVKYEWRLVPGDEKSERQAQNHPMLVTQIQNNKPKKVVKRGSKKEVIEEAIKESEEV